jgi:hypothetical protein
MGPRTPAAIVSMLASRLSSASLTLEPGTLEPLLIESLVSPPAPVSGNGGGQENGAEMLTRGSPS